MGGVLAAQKVLYIEEVVINVREGYELVPLPEGSSYLGFIFARAERRSGRGSVTCRAHLPERGSNAVVEGR